MTKKLVVADEGYEIRVHGHNVAVTDAMKNYVVEKLSKVDRFVNRVMEVDVTLDIQRADHSVNVLMKVGQTRIKIQAVTEDMYASIDKAVDKLTAKLRRYHSRLVDHHAKARSVVDMNVNVFAPTDSVDEINDDIESENITHAENALRPHQITKKETRPLKTLTMHEAEMKMDLSGDTFMVYRSEEDQKLKVIYRRQDRNYGVIEPE